MGRRPSASPDPGPLALQGDLDLFSIRAQWEGLAARSAGGPPRALDLSALGDLDPSGLQLLAVLDRDLRAAGGRLVLAGAPDGWRARAQALGLGDLFEGEAS